MVEDKAIQEIRENILIIKATLDNMVENNKLKLELYDEKIKVANARIKDLEDNSQWVWRAIAGAIITGIIAWFFK